MDAFFPHMRGDVKFHSPVIFFCAINVRLQIVWISSGEGFAQMKIYFWTAVLLVFPKVMNIYFVVP